MSIQSGIQLARYGWEGGCPPFTLRQLGYTALFFSLFLINAPWMIGSTSHHYSPLPCYQCPLWTLGFRTNISQYLLAPKIQPLDSIQYSPPCVTIEFGITVASLPSCSHLKVNGWGIHLENFESNVSQSTFLNHNINISFLLQLKISATFQSPTRPFVTNLSVLQDFPVISFLYKLPSHHQRFPFF